MIQLVNCYVALAEGMNGYIKFTRCFQVMVVIDHVLVCWMDIYLWMSVFESCVFMDYVKHCVHRFGKFVFGCFKVYLNTCIVLNKKISQWVLLPILRYWLRFLYFYSPKVLPC